VATALSLLATAAPGLVPVAGTAVALACLALAIASADRMRRLAWGAAAILAIAASIRVAFPATPAGGIGAFLAARRGRGKLAATILAIGGYAGGQILMIGHDPLGNYASGRPLVAAVFLNRWRRAELLAWLAAGLAAVSMVLTPIVYAGFGVNAAYLGTETRTGAILLGAALLRSVRWLGAITLLADNKAMSFPARVC